MGKFNTISGGFYGKVGQVVGQRWKNIRTVRSYVIPTNPRTQKQQANRSLFGGITSNAQIAQQMNYKAPCFSSPNKTEWNLRMKRGSDLLKGGAEGFNQIPILPNGYVPTYAINTIKLKSQLPSGLATFEVSGTLPTQNRNISVLLGTKQNEDDAFNVSLYSTVLNVAPNKTFEIQVSESEPINSFTKFLIVSNDDYENENKTLFCPETTISPETKVYRTFKTAGTAMTREGATTFIVTPEPYFEPSSVSGDYKFNAVSNGNIVHLNHQNLSFENRGGFFAIRIEQTVQHEAEIYACGTEGGIYFYSLLVDSDDLQLTLSNVGVGLVSSDNTRQLWTEISDITMASGYLDVTLKQKSFQSKQPSQSDGFMTELSYYDGTETHGGQFSAVEVNNSGLHVYGYSKNGNGNWIAPSGSEISFNFLAFQVYGVTYSATNIKIPYSYLHGEMFVGVEPNFTQPIEVGMRNNSKWELPKLVADMYRNWATSKMSAMGATADSYEYTIRPLTFETESVSGVNMNAISGNSLQVQFFAPEGEDDVSGHDAYLKFEEMVFTDVEHGITIKLKEPSESIGVYAE